MSFKDHVIYFVNKLLRKNYPCGRTKKDKHLCCKRPMSDKNSYISSDRKHIYCKYCNSLKMSSSDPIPNLTEWRPWD